MNDRAKMLTDKGIKTLVNALNLGQSDTLKAYLATMARFHRYSWHNCLLIWQQCPTASQVAGFRKWLDLGRCVKKGERGIMILAPMTFTKKTQPSGLFEAEESEIKRNPNLFVTAWVFDVAQTEGRELPGIGKRSGDPGIFQSRLFDFATSKGITVSWADDLKGAKGVSRGGSIQLLAGLSPADAFGVLAHEIAHELLHQKPNADLKPRAVRELEAEATAFVVCEAIGIADGSASKDYIHLYQGDAKLMMASLACIQKTSAAILREILI